jgi:hypothetical protein
MPDDTRKTGKADDIRINVRQSWEVAYWTRKFKVTKKRLLAAVRAVGPMSVNVKRHLKP